jgi:outer membrane lipoprotein SlyB
VSDDPFEAARARIAGKSADPFEAARERLAATPASGPRKSASDFLAEEGTIPTRVRNWGKAKGQSLAQEQEGLTVKDMRKRTAAAVRPVLEGAGAVAGGIGGAAVGGLTGGVTIPLVGAIPGATVGGVTGSALGYATGNQLADMIEGVPNRTATQQVGKTVNQLATGASMEMGGAVLAKGAGALVQGGRNVIQRGVPFSPTRNRINAAQEFGDATTGAQGNWKTTDPGFAERQTVTDSNRLTQVKKATRNRDDALFNRLNADRPGQRPLQPSAGQREGGSLLALEQKQRLKYKTRGTSENAMPFDERVNLNSAVNADAALTRVTKQVGRGEALPASEYASTTGDRIVKSVQESEAAVKPEVRRLFNQPEFKYEMPRVEYDEALESVLNSNLDETARAAVQGVAKFAEGAERTAAGLKSIKETIDGRLSQAIRQGDNAAVAALNKVKQGVWDSFETMGKAAEAGDVAVHEGRIIYPSRLKGQIATLDERIAAETAAGAKPDLAAMRAEMGTQPGMMKITGESDASYATRLTKEYEKAGKPVPIEGQAPVTPVTPAAPQQTWNEFTGSKMSEYMKSEGGHAGAMKRLGAEWQEIKSAPPPTVTTKSNTLADLQARRATLSDTLAAAQPAEDVAASYASARRYTKEEQKDRFARDTIAGILKKGDQYGGLNTPLEQIPDKVFTPRGAHELVRAKMPFRAAGDAADPVARLAAGRDAAGALVYPHVVTRFTKAAIEPSTGIMSIPAAERFLRDNGEVLQTLGLTKDVEQIIKGQLPKAVRAHLDGLGVDTLRNPTMSARLAVKFARKQFGPSIGKYFGSTRAVMDWAHTLEISERSNVVATLRGSNTAEKLDLLALGDKVSMFGAVLAKAGWLMNSIKGAVGAVVKNPMKGAERQVDQFIQDALLDGHAAEALMQIYRAKGVSDISQRAANVLKPYFVQAAVSTTQPDTPTE